MENTKPSENVRNEEQLTNIPEGSIEANAGQSNYTAEDIEALLKDYSYELKELFFQYKDIEKRYDEKKQKYKAFLTQNKLTGYEDDNFKVMMTEIEKQSLDEEKTLAYLKQKKLDKYIHTKEYFIIEELYMAATKNEFNPADLSEFRKITKEQRITIRERKAKKN